MQARLPLSSRGSLAHSITKHGRRKCSLRCSSSANSSALGLLDARRDTKRDLRLSITRLLNENAPQMPDLRLLRAQIDSLNNLNPTPDPSASPSINGEWVLLYTAKWSKAEREDNAFQALSGSLYEQVYKFVPVLGGSAVGKKGSGGAVKARGNFQIFDTDKGIVRNLARFEAFGTQGFICVDGTAEVVRGSEPSEPSSLKAMFTSFCLEFGGEERLKLPLTLLPSPAPGKFSGPVGMVYTTYLDEEAHT